MDKLIDVAVSNCWSKLSIDQVLNTPSGESQFKIFAIHQDDIKIKTNGGTPLTIKKIAFLNALKYLIVNGHFDKTKHCEIRSNQVYESAGPLCKVVRAPNGTMTITYILPILKFLVL